MKSDITVEGLHSLLLSTTKKIKAHCPMRLEKIFKTCQRKAAEYNTIWDLAPSWIDIEKRERLLPYMLLFTVNAFDGTLQKAHSGQSDEFDFMIHQVVFLIESSVSSRVGVSLQLDGQLKVQ